MCVGSHAANPEQISVHAMVREAKAEEEIDGDLQFRPRQGYGALVRWYERRLSGAAIELKAAAQRIRWNDDGVEVQTSRGSFRGHKAIVTFPWECCRRAMWCSIRSCRRKRRLRPD